MEYSEILKILAPCGLNCRKCMAYEKGDIKNHALEMKALLGKNFDVYAERFSSFLPAFQNYPQFKELLDFFGSGDCKGCRSGECKYPACNVIKCHREKAVDFCFQCKEFPCDNPGFDEHLKKRWIKMNSRMKEIGVEAYYQEAKNQPRYI